jgi:hypothetical protein
MPVVRSSRSYEAMQIVHSAGGIEQFKTPIAHPTDANYEYNGYLPLHFFVSNQCWCWSSQSSLMSEQAHVIRWLLRLHPEAASIEGGVGVNKKTPYQLAVDKKLPECFIRLLLRAAPTLNPAELHRLNYAERRMAMFLAFRATAATMEAPLLARLRGENKDLVQRVVSFL